jgi:tetratricopeptide (TPR) repeat protein
LKLNPYSGESIFLKGYALSVKGDTEQALICYEQSCKNDPNNFFAFYNRGVILLKNKKKDEAKKII